MYLPKIPECFGLTGFLALLYHASIFLLSSECEFNKGDKNACMKSVSFLGLEV